MAFDDYGNWQEDEDPYKYADYTYPNSTPSTQDDPWHSYDPQTTQESSGTGNPPFTPYSPPAASNTDGGTPSPGPGYGKHDVGNGGDEDSWVNDAGLEAALRADAAKKGVAYDPSDLAGVFRNISYDTNGNSTNKGISVDQAMKNAMDAYTKRAGNVPGGGAGAPSAAGSPGGGGGGGNGGGGGGSQGLFPDWYREMMQRQITLQEQQAAEAKSRADGLFSTLNTRAGQSLAVNANDPIIRNQTAAFRAQAERARRNYLSDTAEAAGPRANIQGERRMTSEKLGQSVGAFTADQVSRELTARRAEIASALSQMAGMLTGDQTRALQEKLASMDQAIAEANAGTSRLNATNAYDLGLRSNNLGISNLNWSMNPNNPLFRL